MSMSNTLIRDRMVIKTKIRGKEATRTLIKSRPTTEITAEQVEVTIKVTIRASPLISSSSSFDQETDMKTITGTIQGTEVTVAMGATRDAGIERLIV